jgi:uncharacterized protein with FMN-binding domain
MKRVLFSITGTVAGVAALLQFKTSTSHPLTAAALPSAGTGSSSASSSSSGDSVAAAPSPSPSGGSATTKTKQATGSAEQNQYGVVQVQVTESGGKITDVRFVQLTAYDGRSQMINQQAGPILLQETLNAQGANISGVSGATYTSDSYIQSLQNALDQL